MDWKVFLRVFLRNAIIATVMAGAIVGFFGFLVAGREGFLNGATWGIILGLVSVPFTGFIILTKYWGDYAGNYGKWWIKKEMQGEE